MTMASGNKPYRNRFCLFFFSFFLFQRVIFHQISLFKIFTLNTDQILSVRTYTLIDVMNRHVKVFASL